jgi:agmatinase
MSVRQAARTLRPGYHVELGVTPLEEVQIVDAGDVTVTPYDISEACAGVTGIDRQSERRGQALIVSSGH